VTAVVAVTIFVAAYALIASEKINRTVVALAGAALMLALHIVDAEDAFHSLETGIDWEVIGLLLGMMVVVGVLKQTGIFEFLAIWSAKKARGRPYRIMVALILITAVASALLDNVTTVLLIAPVTILICERLTLPVMPYLIAQALASNIGGTATLIGDPPNIIIASRSGLSYLDFIVHLAPFVLFLLAIFIVLVRVMFRTAYRYDAGRAADIMRFNEKEAIADKRLLGYSLAVTALATAAFALHEVLHYSPAVIALLAGGALLMLSRRAPESILREVEWETLAFFAGLFVMVGGLVKVGTIGELADAAATVMGDDALLGSTLLVWLSGVLSAIVDNIPYVATMAPVVATLTEGLPADQPGTVLWWALALGADLGGNATAIGASANVVVLGLAKRAGYPITFWQFTKYGLITAAITLLLSTLYLWLRYFALA
jgi:Na+/H+ antiporter NhaD/arsenite permease-like protein